MGIYYYEPDTDELAPWTGSEADCEAEVETVEITKKEYDLLKKHQDEYKKLIEVLADEEHFLEIYTERLKDVDATPTDFLYRHNMDLIMRTIEFNFKRKVGIDYE